MKYKLKRDFTDLGIFLNKQRIKNNLTQKEVSDTLGYSSAQFISNFERGLVKPPVDKARMLIKLYKLNANDVLFLQRLYVSCYRKKISQELTKGIYR